MSSLPSFPVVVTFVFFAATWTVKSLIQWCHCNSFHILTKVFLSLCNRTLFTFAPYSGPALHPNCTHPHPLPITIYYLSLKRHCSTLNPALHTTLWKFVMHISDDILQKNVHLSNKKKRRHVFLKKIVGCLIGVWQVEDGVLDPSKNRRGRTFHKRETPHSCSFFSSTPKIHSPVLRNSF